MSKSNKFTRSIDEKHHHNFQALKTKSYQRTVNQLDRVLKNKKYSEFDEDEDNYDMFLKGKIR